MAQTLDNLLQTWNNVATTFTGIKYNVTDTASAAGSRLMDLQVGGSSLFHVTKEGIAVIPGGGITRGYVIGSVKILNNSNSIYFSSAASSFLTPGAALTANGYHMPAAAYVGWGPSTTLPQGEEDTRLFRDGAAGVLAQRRTTTAGPVTFPQTFRIYNEYTDASNYERGKIEWASNVLRIGTEKLGSGTERALEFQTNGLTRLTIAATGLITTSVSILVGATNRLGWSTRSITLSPADGVITLYNNAETDFNRLQFGGATSSFPALKRSSATLQARLADDSAFTNIQGKLTTETAYAAGAPTATGYIVLYDSTGTAYKVPAEAL